MFYFLNFWSLLIFMSYFINSYIQHLYQEPPGAAATRERSIRKQEVVTFSCGLLQLPLLASGSAQLRYRSLAASSSYLCWPQGQLS